MAGLVANVRVGLLEVHLAYECRPDHDTREFVEVFLPDERGTPNRGPDNSSISDDPSVYGTSHAL